MSIISEVDYLVADLRTAELIATMLQKNYKGDWHSLYTDVLESGVFRSGTLLSHKYCGEWDMTCLYQLYHFPSKNYYVALESHVGSCVGCLRLGAGQSPVLAGTGIIQKVEDNVRRAYVTDSAVDIAEYGDQAVLKMEFAQ